MHTSSLPHAFRVSPGGFGGCCIKKPPGVEPSPRAAVEETQSVLGAEILKEEAAHAQVLSGEPGVAAAPGHPVCAELPG